MKMLVLIAVIIFHDILLFEPLKNESTGPETVLGAEVFDFVCLMTIFPFTVCFVVGMSLKNNERTQLQ
jgi:hypothetical protein